MKNQYDSKHYVYIMKPKWAFRRQRFNWYYIKVGISKNPQRRLKEFQTAYPCKVDMVRIYDFAFEKEARALETKIHKRYKKYRLKDGGKEWLYVPRWVLNEIKLDLLTSDHSSRSTISLRTEQAVGAFFTAIEKRIAKWRGKEYEENTKI